MLDNGHWLYLAFMCQQAVEKLSKALYVLYIDDNVPHIHSIGLIVRKYQTMLPMPVGIERFKFFDLLSKYYIDSRYPEYKLELSLQFGKKEAVNLFSQTEEAFQWLLKSKPLLESTLPKQPIQSD
jgi:HEPN domain-containing protein